MIVRIPRHTACSSFSRGESGREWLAGWERSGKSLITDGKVPRSGRSTMQHTLSCPSPTPPCLLLLGFPTLPVSFRLPIVLGEEKGRLGLEALHNLRHSCAIYSPRELRDRGREDVQLLP